MQRLILGLERLAGEVRNPVALMLAQRFRADEKQAVILIGPELGNIAIGGEHP